MSDWTGGQNYEQIYCCQADCVVKYYCPFNALLPPSCAYAGRVVPVNKCLCDAGWEGAYCEVSAEQATDDNTMSADHRHEEL